MFLGGIASSAVAVAGTVVTTFLERWNQDVMRQTGTLAATRYSAPIMVVALATSSSSLLAGKFMSLKVLRPSSCEGSCRRTPSVFCHRQIGNVVGILGSLATVLIVQGMALYILLRGAEPKAAEFGASCLGKLAANSTACKLLEDAVSGDNAAAACAWVVSNLAAAGLGVSAGYCCEDECPMATLT